MEHVDPTTGDVDEQADEPRSRRQLLRLAGAAAAGGAGLVVAGASPAAAASGGALIMGSFNNDSEGDLTGLNADSTFASLSIGTDGMTGSVTALSASSDQYMDLKLNGTGRLGLRASLTGNAQPSYDPSLNDLVKSSTGALWSGKGDLDEANPTWKRINAVRVDNPNGNGAAFAPFRFYDSRNTSALTVGASRTLDVRANANIPDDAIAIFGNMTVTGSTFGGWANIWPTGVAEPPTSSINFTTGQSVANFFFVGLGTSGGNAGKVNIIPRRSAGGGTAHIIIDITAYVQ
jgi:hypothetical protein